MWMIFFLEDDQKQVDFQWSDFNLILQSAY